MEKVIKILIVVIPVVTALIEAMAKLEETKK